MKKLLSVLLLSLFCSVNACLAQSSQTLTEEKKRVVDELLELSGATKIGEMMGVAVANQVIEAMSQQNKTSPEVIAAVQDETAKVMREQFIESGFLHEMSYEIYDKHFSTSELEEVVAFYKTPTGRKMTSLLPEITQQSMVAGQQHALDIQPILQQRIKTRLKEEGLE